jgi:hypothetical protein
MHFSPAHVKDPLGFATVMVPFISLVQLNSDFQGSPSAAVVTVPPRLQVQFDQLADLISPFTLTPAPPPSSVVSPEMTDVLHLTTAKPDVRTASFPPVNSALITLFFGYMLVHGNVFVVHSLVAEAVPDPSTAIVATAATAARPNILMSLTLDSPFPGGMPPVVSNCGVRQIAGCTGQRVGRSGRRERQGTEQGSAHSIAVAITADILAHDWTLPLPLPGEPPPV